MSDQPKPLVQKILGAPSLVKVGAACGTIGGLAIGAMVSTPVIGLAAGVVLGAIVGIISGTVMDREDRLHAARMRELDDIIGVTSGSLGAPPSVPPEGPTEQEREAELRSWVTEWITPAPPTVV